MGCSECRAVWMATVATLLALTCSGPVYGQEQRRDREAIERPRRDVPDSDRERYRDAEGRRARRSQRRSDSRPQFYRDGEGYRYGVPVYDERFQAELERAYQRGLEDGRRLERYDVQNEGGPSTYRGAMARGKDAFEDGDYGLAARQFLLATTLNQGDPASRLAAAHALVAMGTYEPAVRLLRRAFELQPSLVYLPLQIRGAYGNPDHYALHLTALRKAAQSDPNNPGIWFLLGYFGYYSNDMAEAADALGRAAKLLPNDGLIQQLYGLASLSAPRTSPGSDERKPQPGDGHR